MRRTFCLFLFLLLLPACVSAEDTVSPGSFFYLLGAWESVQAEDFPVLSPVACAFQDNETVYRTGSITAQAGSDGQVYLVRAELDASDAQSVSTLVSLCAALASDTDPSSDHLLQYLSFLHTAAAAETADPAMLGAYEVYLQSDGSMICFSALLSGYDPSAPSDETADPQETDEAPICRVSTSGGKLRMRAEASAKARILIQIPNGAVVTLLERGEEWCRIQYGDRTGYVMTEYLSITP